MLRYILFIAIIFIDSRAVLVIIVVKVLFFIIIDSRLTY
jgi:hypothetical protein